MKRFLLLVLFLLSAILMNAQTGGVSIGKDSQIAHVKAILDIVSNSKGLLIPRMTTSQRDKMFSKEDDTSKSLLVFDVNLNSFMYWTGKEWESLAKGSNTIIADNLDSDSQYMSLSARQGKILKDMLEAEFLTVNEKLRFASDSLLVQRNAINKNYKDISLLNKSFYLNQDSLMVHRVAINNNRLKSDEQIVINANAIKSNSDVISTAKNDLQSEIDVTQAGSGLQAQGAYVANVNSSFIKTAVSLKDADEKLDVQLKKNETGISLAKADIISNTVEIAKNSASLSVNSEAITQSKADLKNEIAATRKGSGLELIGTYIANANSHYIKTAVSLKDADSKLDVQLKTNADKIGSNSNEIAQKAISITSNTNAITNNTNKITVNTTAISANETGLSTANTNISNNTAEIVSNSSSISVNNNSISNNSSRITENALGITSNKASLLAANAKITANALGILANKTSIAALSESLGGIPKLQKELDDTQVGTGLCADGSYEPNSNSSYLKNAISLKDADNKLDKRISKNEFDIFYGWRMLQDELDKTQLGSGLEEAGDYVANESSNYINTAVSLKDADDKLDAQVKINSDAIVNNSNRITANETAIVGANTNITTNTANIAANTANIATNITAIGGKADKVASPEAGDLQYFDGTSWKRLPKGTEGQVLVMVNDKPIWSDKLLEYLNKLKECSDAIMLIPKNIGDSFGGGKIAYINTGSSTDAFGIEPGHGLIVMDEDLGNDVQWFAGDYIVTGANSTTDGMSNTQKILDAQGTVVSYAARLCAECTEGGYNDWYLPSKDELNLLYLNKDVIGGLSSSGYWSSTESSALNAWGQDFGGGYQGNAGKSYNSSVRCIRRF